MYRNWGVTAKFVSINVLIVLISISITGFILYSQASRSAVSQAQIVMEQNLLQTRDSIHEKINMVENTAQIIAFDRRIQTFLGSAFTNESFQLEEYRFQITPILDNMMNQNKSIHALHVYMQNESIPEVYELYNGFLGSHRLAGDEAHQSFVNNSSIQTEWRSLHPENITTTRIGLDAKEDVFAYYRKIYSLYNLEISAIIEVEVTRNVLFQPVTETLSGLGNVYILDSEGREVNGSHLTAGQVETGEMLPQLPANERFNEIREVGGEESIVISVPVEGPNLRLVGVFPVRHFNGKVIDSIDTMLMVLAASLIVIFVLVNIVTVKLLARMKLLLKAMKQVRDGSLDVSVPVVGNDEFSQMALSFNHMTGRIHELVETVYKSKLLEREAELKALESQINPHFLYNTLATISWVARKAQVHEVTHLSNTLAKFYRMVLNKGNSQTLISNEVEMVKAYLSIQKFRFEDRFDAVFEIDERILDCWTIKSILQPLVENALNHGIEPKRSHGTIIIKAGYEMDRVLLSVIDDGVGIEPDRLQDILEGRPIDTAGSGYAVRNIMQRLQAYYGGDHTFMLYSKPGIGTVVKITFAEMRRFEHA